MSPIPLPWSREQLKALLPTMESTLRQMAESQDFEVRPIGAQTCDEARELLNNIMDIAHERPLTAQECFLHGQLLSAYRMAIIAEVLGRKGRYFVFSEAQMNEHFERATKTN